MQKIIVGLFPLFLLINGCSGPHETSAASVSNAPGVGVKTFTAEKQLWPDLYEAAGTVRAISSTVVAAKWMGYVRGVRVRVGDRVKAGQLLITLDARDLDTGSHRAEAAREEVRSSLPEADSGIAVAQANLRLAEVTFKRMQELYEKTSVSNQEFDEASARVESARATLEMAKARRAQLDAKLAQAEQEARAAQVTRSYADIEAPSAGIVTAKSVEVGDLAAPGAPLLTLESERYRMEASVDEAKMASIRLGQSGLVVLDGDAQGILATVSEIVPAVDASSRTYLVKLNLPPSPGLRSGVFGRVRFQAGVRPVLTIPAEAVSQRGQLESVFAVEDGFARTRLVTLGERRAGDVEALSGLSAGDRVIVPVPGNLVDGAKVEVRP